MCPDCASSFIMTGLPENSFLGKRCLGERVQRCRPDPQWSAQRSLSSDASIQTSQLAHGIKQAGWLRAGLPSGSFLCDEGLLCVLRKRKGNLQTLSAGHKISMDFSPSLVDSVPIYLYCTEFGFPFRIPPFLDILFGWSGENHPSSKIRVWPQFLHCLSASLLQERTLLTNSQPWEISWPRPGFLTAPVRRILISTYIRR